MATPDLATSNPGTIIATAMTFIPGYTWNPNVDMYDSKNTFFFLSFEENGYNTFPTYEKRDFNISYIIPQDVRYNNAGTWNGLFIPSFAYMGSAPTYRYENHWIEFKVSCNTCQMVVSNPDHPSDEIVKTFPNPAISQINIQYEVAGGTPVAIRIFDVTGKEIAAINEGVKAAGVYTTTFSVAELPAGVYFYNVSTGNSSVTNKFVITK